MPRRRWNRPCDGERLVPLAVHGAIGRSSHVRFWSPSMPLEGFAKKTHTRGNVDAIVISQVDRGVLVFYPPPQGDCHPTRNVSVRDCVFEADRLKYPYLSPARCDPVYSAKSSGGDNGYPAELGTAEGEVVDGDIRLVCAAVRCR